MKLLVSQLLNTQAHENLKDLYKIAVIPKW